MLLRQLLKVMRSDVLLSNLDLVTEAFTADDTSFYVAQMLP